MKEQTLLNLVANRDMTDLWSRLDTLIQEMDTPNDGEELLTKIMSAVVFTEAMRHITATNTIEQDIDNQVSGIRSQVRKSISQLNEKRPFDALEVQERVFAAIRTHRRILSSMCCDIDSTMDFMAMLSSQNNGFSYDNEDSVTFKLGHSAFSELFNAATVPLKSEISQGGM